MSGGWGEGRFRFNDEGEEDVSSLPETGQLTRRRSGGRGQPIRERQPCEARK